MRIIILVLIYMSVQTISFAQKKWFASVQGKPTNDGSYEHPRDLFSIIDRSTTPLSAGDTLFILEGVYEDTNISFELPGTKESPCVVKPYNNGKVILKGNSKTCSGVATFRLSGTYTEVYDLVITQTARNRITKTIACDDSWGGIGEIGAVVQGEGTKMINCFIYNCASTAINSPTSAVNAEIYGNVSFYNGYSDGIETGRTLGHGHGLYFQNDNGKKNIENNIFFKGFGYGIQFYSAAKTPIDGCDFIDNVVFSFGSLKTSEGSTGAYNYLIDSKEGGKGSFIRGNHSYHEILGDGFTIGYSGVADDITFENNYVHGGSKGLSLNRIRYLEGDSNVIVMNNKRLEYRGYDALTIEVNYPSDNDYIPYGFDKNMYYLQKEKFIPAHLDLHANWSDKHSFDKNSIVEVYSDGDFSEVPNYVRVVPNKYEKKRANIIVHNHKLLPSVEVDVSDVFNVGDHYWLYDVEDMRSPIVEGGVIDGKTIKISTDQKTVFPITGIVSGQPVHSGNDFGTFILIGRELDIVESSGEEVCNVFMKELEPSDEGRKLKVFYSLTGTCNNPVDLSIENKFGQEVYSVQGYQSGIEMDLGEGCSSCTSGKYLAILNEGGKKVGAKEFYFHKHVDLQLVAYSPNAPVKDLLEVKFRANAESTISFYAENILNKGDRVLLDKVEVSKIVKLDNGVYTYPVNLAWLGRGIYYVILSDGINEVSFSVRKM